VILQIDALALLGTGRGKRRLALKRLSLAKSLNSLHIVFAI